MGFVIFGPISRPIRAGWALGPRAWAGPGQARAFLPLLPETTNSSPVDESDELPKGFRALGMMPNT